MELTNLQRNSMGIEEVSPSWERIELDKEHILFFGKDIIRKMIIVTDDTYCEYKMSVRTADNRKQLCPKTDKGKLKPLTVSNIKKYTPEGSYFAYYKGHVVIGNMSTQRTYYSSKMAGLNPMSWNELERFLVRWVEETDAEKMAEVHEFAVASRRHCKFREGDFFKYRIDRTHFGYAGGLTPLLDREGKPVISPVINK